MQPKINTKFGSASIGNHGYYKINSSSEGNYGKLLHRLIYEDYHKVCLLKGTIIHHLDGNKLNNSPDNLELMNRQSHASLHSTGRTVVITEETKEKISNTLKGRKLPKKTRNKIINKYTDRFVNNNKKIKVKSKLDTARSLLNSKKQNTTGYFRVTKGKNSQCVQGFTWCYKYYDKNNKQQNITCVDINKLKQKVLTKGLPWGEYNEKGEIIFAET